MRLGIQKAWDIDLSYLSDNTKEYFCFIGQYSDMPTEKAQGASIILVPGYSRNVTQLRELLRRENWILIATSGILLTHFNLEIP